MVTPEMEDDLPAPMPPARAVDADLPHRVARGLGGVWDARQIEGLIAWMQRYERAEHEIKEWIERGHTEDDKAAALKWPRTAAAPVLRRRRAGG